MTIMTPILAHQQIKALHASAKRRRLPESQRSALRFCLTMLSQAIGDEVLAEAEKKAAEQRVCDAAGLPPTRGSS